MVHLVAGSGPWIFPDFLDQRVKFLKNHKMKNTTGILVLSRVIKKHEIFKKWKFYVFWWFSRPVDKGIMHKSCFWKCLFANSKCHEIRKSSWFFVRRPWSIIPENMKNTFFFFSLQKFVTRYCFNSNDEKTLKINEKHQTHRNSKLNRVFKKYKNSYFV